MVNQFPRLLGFIGLLVGLLALTTACASTEYSFKGSRLEPPQPVPDLELMSTQNRPFHFSETKGHLTLVYFGYTFCPDVCPLTLVDVKKALADLEGGQDQVQVLFVTVDPKRDTPEVLGRYLNAFDPTYIGLSDEPAKIEAAKEAFKVFSEEVEVDDSAAGYLISHSTYLYVLNQKGEVKLLYPFGFAPEDLRSDLEYLLAQS